MAERLTGFDYCFTRCMEPGADKQEIREDCSLYKVCLERQIFEKLQHYEDLEEQGKLIELPCKIGDTVYGTRRWHGTKIAKAGTVSEMFYTQEGKLMIVVKYVCRGYWGEKIFATLEEAEAALKGAEHDTSTND